MMMDYISKIKINLLISAGSASFSKCQLIIKQQTQTMYFFYFYFTFI